MNGKQKEARKNIKSFMHLTRVAMETSMTEDGFFVAILYILLFANISIKVS
jgi:hypothetical protein